MHRRASAALSEGLHAICGSSKKAFVVQLQDEKPCYTNGDTVWGEVIACFNHNTRYEDLRIRLSGRAMAEQRTPHPSAMTSSVTSVATQTVRQPAPTALIVSSSRWNTRSRRAAAGSCRGWNTASRSTLSFPTSCSRLHAFAQTPDTVDYRRPWATARVHWTIWLLR